MANWIEFRELGETGQTKIWEVRSKSQDSRLGRVRWWSPWWQYIFIPEPGTLYSSDCMRDIAAFCEEAAKKHKRQPAMVGE